MKLRFGKLSTYTSFALSGIALAGWVLASTASHPEFYINQPSPYPVPQYHPAAKTIPLPLDTPTTANDTMHFPFHDRYSDPISSQYHNSPLYLNDPSNIKTDVQYDPDNNRYNINENMGSLFYRSPSYMTFDEFVEHEYKHSTKELQYVLKVTLKS